MSFLKREIFISEANDATTVSVQAWYLIRNQGSFIIVVVKKMS